MTKKNKTDKPRRGQRVLSGPNPWLKYLGLGIAFCFVIVGVIGGGIILGAIAKAFVIGIDSANVRTECLNTIGNAYCAGKNQTFSDSWRSGFDCFEPNERTTTHYSYSGAEEEHCAGIQQNWTTTEVDKLNHNTSTQNKMPVPSGEEGCNDIYRASDGTMSTFIPEIGNVRFTIQEKKTLFNGTGARLCWHPTG